MSSSSRSNEESEAMASRNHIPDSIRRFLNHSTDPSNAEPLQPRSTNDPASTGRVQRVFDIRAHRVYPPGELLRIGAAVRNQLLRRNSSLQDLSRANAADPITRRSASAYNGISGNGSSTQADRSMERSSTQEATISNPTRQPINPGGDFDWQKAQGFARFIKDHASPRHHRVTAGGRIVPAIPSTPPPTFHDAFLDAFLETHTGQSTSHASRQSTERQHQNASQQSIAQQNPARFHHHPIASYTPYQMSSYVLHPAMKIPAGFHVVQVAYGGTTAIAIRNSTTYQCDLTPTGETSCKIIARRTSPLNPQSQTQHVPQDSFLPDLSHVGHDPTIDLDRAMHFDGIGTAIQTPYAYSNFRRGSAPLPQSWSQVEQQLQQSFQSDLQQQQHLAYYNSHLQGPAFSIPTTPGAQSTTYQQQLAALNETIQGWTMMLMDAERVLCFPKVLGPAGVESTQMKRQVMLVKIDELTRKKQQVEGQLAQYSPERLELDSESGYQISSGNRTEFDIVEPPERFQYQEPYEASGVVESRILSPLAPAFVPKEHVVPPPRYDISSRRNQSTMTEETELAAVKPGEKERDIVAEISHSKLESKDYNPGCRASTPSQRAASHTYGIVQSNLTCSRLVGESDEEYTLRCFKQRQQPNNYQLSSTKIILPALPLSPQKSMPELPKYRATSGDSGSFKRGLHRRGFHGVSEGVGQ